MDTVRFNLLTVLNLLQKIFLNNNIIINDINKNTVKFLLFEISRDNNRRAIIGVKIQVYQPYIRMTI